MIRNIIKWITNKNQPNKIKLGRWSYENSGLKSHFANHDHCGDIICKDPISLKKNINSENNFKKNDKKS